MVNTGRRALGSLALYEFSLIRPFYQRDDETHVTYPPTGAAHRLRLNGEIDLYIYIYIYIVLYICIVIHFFIFVLIYLIYLYAYEYDISVFYF